MTKSPNFFDTTYLVISYKIWIVRQILVAYSEYLNFMLLHACLEILAILSFHFSKLAYQ